MRSRPPHLFFKIQHTGSKSIPDVAGFLTTAAKLLLLNDYSKIESFFEANNNKESHGSSAAGLYHVPMLNLLRRLQHLSFHRVQQLSAMVYLYEQRESINEKDLTVMEPTQRESEKIISEIGLLVEFLFFIANILSADISVGDDRSSHSICCSNIDNLDSPWILLAQSVAIWAPYASAKNIQVFLKWQFNVSVEESLRREELDDVDFFVIFIRCLRVDRHTAERLQNMCKLSLTTCVSQLVATSQLKVVKKNEQ